MIVCRYYLLICTHHVCPCVLSGDTIEEGGDEGDGVITSIDVGF
jgi:hypothetical protein